VKFRSKFVAVPAIAVLLLLGLVAVWFLQMQDDPQPAPATSGLSSLLPSEETTETGSVRAKDLDPAFSGPAAGSADSNTEEKSDAPQTAPISPRSEAPALEVVPTPERVHKKDAGDLVIDFVRQDIQSVVHYMAMNLDLDVILEGGITQPITVSYRIPRGDDKVKFRQAVMRVLRSICNANNLDMIEDGTTIIIKKKAGPEPEPTVTAGALDGRWNVNFENASPWTAAGQCAKLMKVGLSLPLQLEQDADLKFSIYMREATPTAIMQRIAAEAGMEVIETTENGAPHFEFRRR
jgi:hypothetical protein